MISRTQTPETRRIEKLQESNPDERLSRLPLLLWQVGEQLPNASVQTQIEEVQRRAVAEGLIERPPAVETDGGES